MPALEAPLQRLPVWMSPSQIEKAPDVGIQPQQRASWSGERVLITEMFADAMGHIERASWPRNAADLGDALEYHPVPPLARKSIRVRLVQTGKGKIGEFPIEG